MKNSMERIDDNNEPLVSATEQHGRPSHGGSSDDYSSAGDISPVTGVLDFTREFAAESKKLWYLAAPAVVASFCDYSLGATVQVFAGHVSNLSLVAVSVENDVISTLSFGVMIGMGSALETLCGQGYGAGQLEMLGVYMQRSWIILSSTALILCLLYIFAAPLLKSIGLAPRISEAAGLFSIWMIPEHFSYALGVPMDKFLQAQGKTMEMAVIAVLALVSFVVLAWVLVLKIGWGLAGAAAALNMARWFVNVAQVLYIVGGGCGGAWLGFSSKAFSDLWGFVRLSLESAVMLCLETWYPVILILSAAYLENPEVSVDGLSICLNIMEWTGMIASGISAALSVRVSNELGAGHPRAAKFSLMVAVTSSAGIAVLISILLITFQDQYPVLFAGDEQVRNIVKQLTPSLALTIVVKNIQPVLSGVAVGAGWQAVGAYVNIGCYCLLGIPLSLILGCKLNLGVKGIWSGMVTGILMQTCVLSGMIYRTNWNKEALIAEDRTKKWGGDKS